ncbi:MAG: hypothetical protein AMXMBFR84_01280 [Candidatus Hydrogenedentota bacterium]
MTVPREWETFVSGMVSNMSGWLSIQQESIMNRRSFLVSLAAAANALENVGQDVAPTSTPGRWRGFNLLEKFIAESKSPFVERDFAWMQQWGFDFVRLPMDYRCWARQDDWLTLDEPELKEIDDAVTLGGKYGVHVSINFHRAPGYSVNPNPPEPVSLWEDENAQAAFAQHWRHFAARYAGVPNDRVSFNLLNEPAKISEDRYVRVALRAIEAIRDVDADRLIISDGLHWARQPVKSLAVEGVAQSTRGYDPMPISHYQASWVNGSDKWPLPEWPSEDGENSWNQDRLRTMYDAWRDLAESGVVVHVGEFGAFNRTPHAVVMAWMKDNLEIWKEAGWGWALWNLRGSFGVVDSGRSDVVYEEFDGHKLDKAMLDLLRNF